MNICEEQMPVLESKTSAGCTSFSIPYSEIEDLWIFGDRMGIPKLQNAAINALHKYLQQTWTSHYLTTLESTYLRTVAGSKLRAFTVEFAAYASNLKHIGGPEKPKITRPIEFDDELLCRLGDIFEVGGRPWDLVKFWTNLNLCRFHIHDESIGCNRPMPPPPSVRDLPTPNPFRGLIKPV